MNLPGKHIFRGWFPLPLLQEIFKMKGNYEACCCHCTNNISPQCPFHSNKLIACGLFYVNALKKISKEKKHKIKSLLKDDFPYFCIFLDHSALSCQILAPIFPLMCSMRSVERVTRPWDDRGQGSAGSPSNCSSRKEEDVNPTSGWMKKACVVILAVR